MSEFYIMQFNWNKYFNFLFFLRFDIYQLCVLLLISQFSSANDFVMQNYVL